MYHECSRTRLSVSKTELPLAAMRTATAGRPHEQPALCVGPVKVESNPRRLRSSGDGKTLVVSNYLAGFVNGDRHGKPQSRPALRARHELRRRLETQRRHKLRPRGGEILFNSAKMTFQSQFTCASCHPNGGADGLNWDLPRDGIGNFLNAHRCWASKTLPPTAGTVPVPRWPTASPAPAALHQHEPTEQETTDLVAYLKTLAVPRPLPQKASAKQAIARGRAIFQEKANAAMSPARALDDD